MRTQLNIKDKNLVLIDLAKLSKACCVVCSAVNKLQQIKQFQNLSETDRIAAFLICREFVFVCLHPKP